MKSNIEKTVYTCFCTDVIHEGHLNIIRKSKELGRLTVGVLCDSEMIRYNRFPLIPIEERIRMIEEIPEVDEVIVQNTIMYDEIVKDMKPDFIVHGNNWDDLSGLYIPGDETVTIDSMSTALTMICPLMSGRLEERWCSDPRHGHSKRLRPV